VSTLATQSPSLHATRLLPIDVITLPSNVCASISDELSTGILYWRQTPCELLPAGDFKTVSVDNKDLPEFPKFSSLLELVGYVDASHATDLRTRRSVTGLSFCLAGGAIAFKSKLQPTVATSSTESEFIARRQDRQVLAVHSHRAWFPSIWANIALRG
jgi:hypothetical protein